jgi:hypothetical protein
VVGLDREGVEGWVRREQKLTGEEVATVRWFRWGSGREEWLGSVSGVRGSSLGGCSGAERAGVSCPRRTGGRRSGGRGRRWCSGLGVCAARRSEEAPAFATVAARWRLGEVAGGVSCVGKARGEGNRAGRGRGRRVERPGAGGGAWDGLERR